MTGSGKTTFALRYLLNAPAAAYFIFDDLGRAATRLRIRPARTAREVEQALASRWVVFNPHTMFPGETKQAFRWFCSWIAHVAQRGPGRKLVMVDEVWQWQTPSGLSGEFARLVQAGREDGVELVLCTQLPHKLHAAVVGQAAEVVAFRLDERLALAKLAELGFRPAEVANLPLWHWIARNRLTGREIQGQT
jgi:hypothetical protein